MRVAPMILVLGLLLPLSGRDASAGQAGQGILQRHAAYHAETRAKAQPLTRGQQRIHRLKVLAARLFAGGWIGGFLEIKSNQGSMDDHVARIITAGELRVRRLGLSKGAVAREVQAEIDGLRRDSRAAGNMHYTVNVPENLLGVK